jgi:hypothetical protein
MTSAVRKALGISLFALSLFAAASNMTTLRSEAYAPGHLGELVAENSTGFPFELSGKGFVDYLNTRTWGDGNERVFASPRNCYRRQGVETFYGKGDFDIYTCTADMKLTSAVGVKTCSDYSITFDRIANQYDVSTFNLSKCSDYTPVQQVAPPPAETNPQPDTPCPDPMPSVRQSSVNMNLVGGGIAIFAICVGSAYMLGLSKKR